MKKFSWIFALLCTIALLFSFASCGGGDDPGGTTPDDPPPDGDVPITGVAITYNGEEKTEFEVPPNQEPFTLGVKITPANTTAVKTVTWLSSDTTVAEVSATGVVTIKGADGDTATITATSTADPTKKGTLELTVKLGSSGAQPIPKAPEILWDGTAWATELGNVEVVDEDFASCTWPNFSLPSGTPGVANGWGCQFDITFENVSKTSDYTSLKIQITKDTGTIVASPVMGWVGLYFGEEYDYINYDELPVDLSNANKTATITITLEDGEPQDEDENPLGISAIEALETGFGGINLGGFVNEDWNALWGNGAYKVDKIWFE